MKIPLPRGPGYGGHYSSSQPAPRIWMPGRKRRLEARRPVAKRFRRLRLKRRRRSRVERMNPLALFALLTIAVIPLIVIGFFAVGLGRFLLDFLTSL